MSPPSSPSSRPFSTFCSTQILSMESFLVRLGLAHHVHLFLQRGLDLEVGREGGREGGRKIKVEVEKEEGR